MWPPFSSLVVGCHKQRFLHCSGSIRQSNCCFCFECSTFARRLLSLTFVLGTWRRRSSIDRVVDRKRPSYFWRRTFVGSTRERSKLGSFELLWRLMVRNLA